jgi:hypothetical protein
MYTVGKGKLTGMLCFYLYHKYVKAKVLPVLN